MINEGIAMVKLSEVNDNWRKFPIKENIYNRTDGWLEKRSISTGYNQVTTYDGPFQSMGTVIMAVDEV